MGQLHCFQGAYPDNPKLMLQGKEKMKRAAHIILKTRTMREMDWGVVKGPTHMMFY